MNDATDRHGLSHNIFLTKCKEHLKCVVQTWSCSVGMCVEHSAFHLHRYCHHSHCLHHRASMAQHRCLSSHTWGGLLDKLCCVDSDHEFHLMLHYPCSHSHHCRPGIMQRGIFLCCKMVTILKKTCLLWDHM